MKSYIKITLFVSITFFFSIKIAAQTEKWKQKLFINNKDTINEQTNKSMKTQLSLDSLQEVKLRMLNINRTKQLDSVYRDTKINQDEKLNTLKKINEQYRKEMKKLLSQEQYESFIKKIKEQREAFDKHQSDKKKNAKYVEKKEDMN